MDTGRLKSVVILILLLADLCLGGLVLGDRLNTADVRAQTRSELRGVLKELGVELESGSIPNPGEAVRCTVARNPETEAELAEALLGNVQMEDQGGNIHLYQNASGWARFRGNGEFEVALLSAGGSVEERLRSGGMSAVREGDEYILRFRDQPVFNCSFRLSLLSGGGVRIRGRGLPGETLEPQPVATLDEATLLLRFHDRLSEDGVVYTRIRGIRQGYLLQSAGAEALLLPVWRIDTDSGVRFLELDTGTLVGG